MCVYVCMCTYIPTYFHTAFQKGIFWIVMVFIIIWAASPSISVWLLIQCKFSSTEIIFWKFVCVADRVLGSVYYTVWFHDLSLLGENTFHSTVWMISCLKINNVHFSFLKNLEIKYLFKSNWLVALTALHLTSILARCLPAQCWNKMWKNGKWLRCLFAIGTQWNFFEADVWGFHLLSSLLALYCFYKWSWNPVLENKHNRLVPLWYF